MTKNYFQIKFGEFFSFWRSKIRIQTYSLPVSSLRSAVKLRVYLPIHYRWQFWKRYPLLFFNDGQDMEAIRLLPQLQALYQAGQIPPLIVVALHAGDRMQEYGTSGQADYKNRGSRAGAYAEFVTRQLLPFLHGRFRCRQEAASTSFAGFSLGGLSAFDLVWQHPEHFGQVGVFSGALWWRSEPFRPDDPDADRIVHDGVSRDAIRPGLRFWFQAGTLDEESDRNQNGVIDAIDDTLDLIDILQSKGYPSSAIRYVEVEGGRHHPDTWGEVLPDFLRWAYGRSNKEFLK
ncbi:MAG: alpha/beta hydrolase-fold protein [Bacteroidota bacterium]